MLAAIRWPANPLRRRPMPEAWSLQFPAPPDPYRALSNVPVRRGVLRFRNCVRPSPRWRRYRSRHAVRLKSRSLLLKEPEHDLVKDGSLPFHHHAQPPEGCLLCPRPLDAQFVERLLIFRRELFFPNLLLIRFDVAYFQVSLVSAHRNIPFDLRRLAQQLRHEQPSLPIHLDPLPPIIHL